MRLFDINKRVKTFLVGNGPIKTGGRSVRGVDAILKGALVKDRRWELRQGRVHAVLDLKSNWTNTENDEALKK